jgi:hypothetical protein
MDWFRCLWPLDLNQHRHLELQPHGASPSLSGVLIMSEIIKSEAISRRRAFSLFGKVAVFAVAASTTALAVSEAEAQTAGMTRRQERRTGRHERRDERRTGRTERREERRGTDTTTTGTGTGQKQ